VSEYRRVPPYAQENDQVFEVSPPEERWAVFGSRYTVPKSPQLRLQQNRSELMNRIFTTMEAKIKGTPCGIEFEMAYQIRVCHRDDQVRNQARGTVR
jgi:hypothetical protein